ncbi:MAG: hypothetical protein VR70_05925 [Rhodospirillaceae bacterium BRH_c57]|nr:MAG: hypothetical protein VR70_05925 [Rhodospirillaceae bacterium BRH_c57]
MSKLPAVIPASTCPKTSLHAVKLGVDADRVDAGAKLDHHDKLLPLPALLDVQGELADAMTPTTADHAATWARMLVGMFPASGAFRDEQHAKVFARGLAMDLSEFPADIVERTVHEIRRAGGAFVPGAGDVYKHASRLMDERRRVARGAAAQVDEHARRAEEAARPKAVPYKDQTPQQRAEFDAMMARLKAGGGLKRVPADREPTPAEIERERQRQLADAATLISQEAAE